MTTVSKIRSSYDKFDINDGDVAFFNVAEKGKDPKYEHGKFGSRIKWRAGRNGCDY